MNVDDEKNFGVFANSRGDKVFRLNTLVLVGHMNGGDERVKVVGLSRGGQYKAIYREGSKLKNLRVKYIPHRFLTHPAALGCDKQCAEQALTHLVARIARYAEDQ